MSSINNLDAIIAGQKLLKPCPFCVPFDEFCFQPKILPQKDGWVMVKCGDCSASIKVLSDYVIQAVASWNMRNGKIDLTLPDGAIWEEQWE